MFQRFLTGLGVALLLALASQAAEPAAIQPAAGLPESSPWKLAALSAPPSFSWVEATGPMRSLKYTGEPYQEKTATQVFAYYASPATLAGEAQLKAAAFPGVVLVHGGGGTAFKEWAELWAKRGYAALAMDLAGQHVGSEGGPGQGDDTKFADARTPVVNHWPYHAVANVIRAHSLLRSFPEVDADRTALTGISWGGYLTCLVAPLDTRFKAAVPVYGCGFLHENSVWLGQFANMKPEAKAQWVKLYDPSSYLAACRVPMLFVNGTNDFAYPLDSYAKSYALVPGEKNIRVTVNLPHGHSQGRAPAEIGAFIDSKLKGGKPLMKLGQPRLAGGMATAPVAAGTPAKSAALNFTTENTAINKRTWKTVEARLFENLITGPLPADATAWFFTATDATGLVISSEIMLGAGAKSP